MTHGDIHRTSTACAHAHTQRIMVGEVALGAGAPIVVQSMTSTDTKDADATLTQIEKLVSAGCDIVRVALPAKNAIDSFREICEASPCPIVADIHFDYRLALAAVDAGAAKLRINPGNIGSWERVDAVIDAAGAAHIPLRIGVNAGSLPRDLAENDALDLPAKLCACALAFVEHIESRGFRALVLSAKAHDVLTTIETYRALSRELPHIPLHLGVTEAGSIAQGTIKSAIAIGSLLAEGIGDTLRVSLTANPLEEVPVAWGILSALKLRRRAPEIISCPTCARTEVDLISIVERVEQRLADCHKPLSVAVMGCAVNGPGEAKDADVGVACGKGFGLIFRHGVPSRRVPEDAIVDELLKEVERL